MKKLVLSILFLCSVLPMYAFAQYYGPQRTVPPIITHHVVPPTIRQYAVPPTINYYGVPPVVNYGYGGYQQFIPPPVFIPQRNFRQRTYARNLVCYEFWFNTPYGPVRGQDTCEWVFSY